MNTSLIYFTEILLRQKENAEQGKLRALPFFFCFLECDGQNLLTSKA